MSDQEIRTARCRNYKAEIVWMITRNNKWCPVDVDNVDEGEIEWASTPKGPVPVYDPKKYSAHFETCGKADDHRKSG